MIQKIEATIRLQKVEGSSVTTLSFDVTIPKGAATLDEVPAALALALKAKLDFIGAASVESGKKLAAALARVAEFEAAAKPKDAPPAEQPAVPLSDVRVSYKPPEETPTRRRRRE